MVVEPLLEDLDGVLGQVAAALAAGRGAARLMRAARGLLRGGVLVRRGTGVPLSLANCGEEEDILLITLWIDCKIVDFLNIKHCTGELKTN